MTDDQTLQAVFGTGISHPQNIEEATKEIFGRAEDQPEADQPQEAPVTGPVIPGQEKQPEYRNRTSTSQFVNDLFDN